MDQNEKVLTKNEKKNSEMNSDQNPKNLDSVKYTKSGSIRVTWTRMEEKRKILEEQSKIQDKAKILMEQTRLKDEQKRLKAESKEKERHDRKRIADAERSRKKEEKKALKLLNKKPDMRGKTEACKEAQKKTIIKLHEGLRRKMIEKHRERKKKYPDSSSDEEEEITIIKKKRSKSRTPDIDYRKLYEDSIRNKTIREEIDEPIRRNSVSPNINRIRDLQRNIFKGIL